MYPIIKNSSGDLLATLNNITSNSLRHKVNAELEFNFKCFEEDYKTEYLQFGNVIEADNQTFDISYIDQSHAVAVEYDVRCEHVFYRLNDPDNELIGYANTATPAVILADLLSGTDFTVGTIDYTTPIVFAVNKNATRMNVILSLVNSLGGKIGFSNKGFTVDIKNELGQDLGYQIRIKKNLSSINKIIDRRGTNKAIYKINAVNIFKSDEMVLDGLENLEQLSNGDRVRVIDETINVDVQLYVAEMEKDVIKDSRLNIVLGDSFDYLSDQVSFIQEQAIKQSDIIYGVKINNELGIEIERTDKLARTKLNADEFRMQKGDGLGNYTDSLYFDPINERYIFVGRLEGSEIVGSTFIAGTSSTIEIGSTGSGNGIIIFRNPSASEVFRITTDGTQALFSSSSSDVFISSDNDRLTLQGDEVYINGGLGPIKFNKLPDVSGDFIATRDWVTGEGYAVGTGVIGNFTTVDGKTVFVSDGVITAIL